MKNKKIVFFPAFRYIIPADFEVWLEEMALKGWQIDHIGQWSSLIMTFRRGESKKYRFIYDLQAVPRKEYQLTYEQFGWEHVGQMASVHIWRQEYTDQRPEAFTDQESIAQRSQRILTAISVSIVICLLTAILMTIPLISAQGVRLPGEIAQLIIAIGVCVVFAILLVLVIIKIYRNRNR